MSSVLRTVRGLLLTAALIAGFVVACQSVPETNRSQLILIDTGSEMKLGEPSL